MCERSDTPSGQNYQRTHRPPHVGNALTISAILEPGMDMVSDLGGNNEGLGVVRMSGSGEKNVPRVKHMHAPRIQHQVTDAGPPNVSGVLNVVAILEQRPMILNAKLICTNVHHAQFSRSTQTEWM